MKWAPRAGELKTDIVGSLVTIAGAVAFRLAMDAIPQQHCAPDELFPGILNDFPCGRLITTMFRSPCPRRLRSSIVALTAWFAFGAMDAGAQDDKPRPAAGPVQPFFEAHCQKCHGGDKHKGDFRIESLTDNFADRQNREKWLTVMEQLEAGDMPPK